METLGSLIDKLTIVGLKQYHNNDLSDGFDREKAKRLKDQSDDLIGEINQYVADAISGKIPSTHMVIPANKIHNLIGVDVSTGSIGKQVEFLADTNSHIWHLQEFINGCRESSQPPKTILTEIGVLNMKRNAYIEGIDRKFVEMLK